jgi:hypothetical protein
MEIDMKPYLKIFWLLMVFFLLALPACGSAGLAGEPTVDTAPIFTQVALTAVAMQTQVALAAVPPVSNTPVATLPEATATPEATPTPLPTDTPPPTSTPTPKPVVVYIPTSTGGGTPSVGLVPSMVVTLSANGTSTYSVTIPTGKPLIMRAEVKNTSATPLHVVANLTVPDGWDVDQNTFSDCPETDTLAHSQSCTISWYFTPQVTGQVILRVYVRGIYTDSAGNSQRITDSPAIIFTVAP